MDFLSHEKELSSTESAHIIIFFLFRNTQRNPSQNRKKKHQREKKNVCHFIFAARACVAKEKRDERDARKSSFSSYSSPFTVLARCHASFRHGFFERVSERNFKSSRVSNVSVRFICLSSSPFLVLRASSCARDVLFLRAFSLSLSL
jgi:hypothetical protein